MDNILSLMSICCSEAEDINSKLFYSWCPSDVCKKDGRVEGTLRHISMVQSLWRYRLNVSDA